MSAINFLKNQSKKDLARRIEYLAGVSSEWLNIAFILRETLKRSLQGDLTEDHVKGLLNEIADGKDLISTKLKQQGVTPPEIKQ